MINRLRQSLRSFLSQEPDRSAPIVSFVLIVYDMSGQAQNTARSLLTDYQIGVSAQDYEVIIVENESGNHLSKDFLDTLPANFHYHLRQEDQPTPINAINFGIEKARGENICVMIDGARVLTPGVVKNTILGHRVSDCSIVTVPGYHLGFELQQKAVSSGYNVDQEQVLMRSISWPDDGYRLFQIACFSGSCAPGFYLAHSESNCISMPSRVWKELGGYDVRFDMRGGGLVNLDLYKRACEYPGGTHVVLQGEGTFHQFHGGVTTGGDDADARERFIQSIKAQYQDIRGEIFVSPDTNPIYLGELSEHALKFVHLSASMKLERMGKNVEALSASA